MIRLWITDNFLDKYRILSTAIPITVRQMLVIWFERTALSLLLAGLLSRLVF